MIYYLPLEHEPMRYTASLDAHLISHLDSKGKPYQRIYPKLPAVFDRELPQGLFLDAPRTIMFKMAQIAFLAEAYMEGTIRDGDTVFLSDIWFPGIESVRYLDFFEKKKVKLVGILHAGSFTDTDFIRQLERWASQFENALFDIFDRVIVASKFIKHEVCSRRLLDPAKVVVSPFPLDARATRPDGERDNLVVFNGRICEEKQPELFWHLQRICRVPHNTRWVSTQQMRLSQEDYYAVLKRAKCVVSFAKQENFGFGVAEAVQCGCYPVVPDRLVYPEFYPGSCLYNSIPACALQVEAAVNSYDHDTQKDIAKWVADRMRPNMDAWFK